MTDLLHPDPGYDYVCQRCLHQWRTRVPNAPRPRCCAKCRSAYYDLPPKEKPVRVESKRNRKRYQSRKSKIMGTKPTVVIIDPVVQKIIPTTVGLPPTFVEPHPLLEPPPHLSRYTIPDLPITQTYYDHMTEPQPENAIRKPVEELVTVESNAGTESTDAEA